MASVARYCCCGGVCAEGTLDCSNCDDGRPPLTFRVTFSGINLCGCHLQDDAGNDANYTPNSSINGSFDLTQTLACQWRGVPAETPTATFKNYPDTSNGSCGGTANPDLSGLGILVYLTRTATTWQLEVFSVQPTFSMTLFSDEQNSDTSGADQLCQSITATFSNDFTGSGDCGSTQNNTAGFPTRVVGYGGTATLVCV